MKSQAKKVMQLFLRQCAIRLLRKYHPEIIAITGSVGKTSAKDAIYEVLSQKFKVRKNVKNLNNEFGVPLTIIGVDSIKKIPSILYKTFFSKNYPQILILEMGADRAGDIKYLTSFVKPNVAVITRVAASHLEFFGSLENIAKEKGVLVESLDKDGFAVLNYDDERVRKISAKTCARSIFFGLDKKSDISASKIRHAFRGIDFDVEYKSEKQRIHLDVIGRHQVYSALSATACGLIYGMNLSEISLALKRYKPPSDRTNIINGIKNTFIINDTYNANPESTRAALEILDEIGMNLNKKARKVFVFGDMLELGPKSLKLHLELIEEMKSAIDILVLVGKINRNVFDNIKGHLKKNTSWFATSSEASEKISQIIKDSDIILVKGSRGMRMENIVQKLKA